MIWEAPLSLNAEIVSGGIPDRSPVISAVIIPFVATVLKGIFAISDFNGCPKRVIRSWMKEKSYVELIEHSA